MRPWWIRAESSLISIWICISGAWISSNCVSLVVNHDSRKWSMKLKLLYSEDSNKPKLLYLHFHLNFQVQSLRWSQVALRHQQVPQPRASIVCRAEEWLPVAGRLVANLPHSHLYTTWCLVSTPQNFYKTLTTFSMWFE